jgi:hypothetical protein
VRSTMFATPVLSNVISLKEKDHHAVRIIIKYKENSPPESSPASVGPVVVYGDQYIFDPAGISPAHIGAIKAIQYNVQFFNNEPGGGGGGACPDGDFIIYVPSSGELISIASGIWETTTPPTVVQNRSTAQGCISVESNPGAQIVFTKAMNVNVAVSGIALVTLFDFPVAPWTIPSTVNFGIFAN